jgi:hypothetical protein
MPAGGAGNARASWRAGKALAKGARAVKRQWDDAWARAKLEVAGGGRKQRTAPVAEVPGEQSRGQRRQEEEGGKNEAGDCFAKLEKNRGLTVKSL